MIDKYANDISKRDSLYKVILNRIDFNKLNKTKLSDTRTNDIGDDVNEETAEFQTDNLGEYLGTDMSGNTSYNVRRVFSLQKINKSLIITIPIVYGPTILTHNTVTATVIGNNLGEFSTPSPPFVNLSYSTDGVSGNCGGDLIEKKTLIYTTNGQIVVKGGLNAGIYTAGAQITGGLTISSSKNSTADYNYALSFTASNPAFANSLRKLEIQVVMQNTWHLINILFFDIHAFKSIMSSYLTTLTIMISKYKVVFIFLSLLLSTQLKAQSKLHTSIKAHYISMNLEDQKDSTKQYWEPVHKMTSSGFGCKWLKNGDIHLYYGEGEPQILNRKNNLDREHTDKIQKSINGFILDGFYNDASQPFNMYYVFYIHPKKKNTLLIQFHEFGIGVDLVYSAVFYTDDPNYANPFRKLDMVKTTGETIKVKL